MPLYPYRCTKCGHRFEKIQSFSSEPETICPQCGGALERLLTAPGLQFKGAGWYVNDYASKGSSSSDSSSAAGSTGNSTGDKAAADTKTSAAESASAPAAAPAAPAAKSSESKS